MTDIHVIAGVAVLAANLLAGAWGGVAWLRRVPSAAFWYLLRAAQAAVVVQVLIGGWLLAEGREPPDGLHYVYGLLPLLVAFLAEGARAGVASRETEGMDVASLPDARRRELAHAILRHEMGIMTLSALVIFGLALRAAFTSGGL